MSDSTKVRVELQHTMNLGNYESLRIGIGIEDYVRADENIEAATQRVYKFVEDTLTDKIKEEKRARDGR